MNLDEVNNKDFYMFLYSLEQVLPINGDPIDIEINGTIKTISKKGSLFFLHGWGWTNEIGLYEELSREALENELNKTNNNQQQS